MVVVHCRVLDGFERFWKVFIEFRCFFVQFWSYGCFESVFGRFRSVVKGSGWFSAVLEGFHRFSLFFVQFWSYGCFESVFGRFRSVLKGSGWFSEALEGFHRFSLFFRPILEV